MPFDLVLVCVQACKYYPLLLHTYLVMQTIFLLQFALRFSNNNVLLNVTSEEIDIFNSERCDIQ